MADFHLTPKQQEGAEILAGSATHILFYGGSRSAKTFLLMLAMITRGLRAPGARQTVLRFRFNHVKQSIIYGTLPQVLKLCFPQVRTELNKSDWFLQLPGGSEIWFGGLDDKERTEKILGNEFCGIFLNECSQIPYSSRNIAMTRLAQRVKDQSGKLLPLRMYYDENPPDKGHWTYKIFMAKQDPDSGNRLSDPDNYVSLKMNPRDNLENLAPEFIHTLEALPARSKKRFLDGEFRDLAPNALFSDEVLEKWRHLDDLPEMLRIVVAIDPSGAGDDDQTEHDDIGIVVAGLGIDGNGYILEDLTCNAGPGVWGKVATDAFDRHAADRIVAEDNFGGAMVKANIQACRPRTPYRNVHASRGKVVRAEPVSTLMESGKVRLAGYFRELEDELCGFTTNGYTGDHSPNRADAMIWAIADLFPELTRPEKDAVLVVATPQPVYRRSPNAWMKI
jgi:phage terminase large subunit-like protein